MSADESTARLTSAGDHKARVRAQFGATAESYVASATHAEGEDLDQLVRWAEGGPDRVALDVATGGGHTALALAPLYRRVVATDLTDAMLHAAQEFARSRGATNVEFRLADAEELPFPNRAFDLVSCRIAPHHFTDVARFVREVARVLRPGGIFLLEDSVAPNAPDDAAFLNRVEKLRDPTHVRTLTRIEWLGCITEAGLQVEEDQTHAKTHSFRSWVDRANVTSEARSQLESLFRGAPPSTRESLRVVVDGSTVVCYSDQKLLVKARKPAT
jgi:ubiquinone/menaquinone biosynthesis C-methylase UbiE